MVDAQSATVSVGQIVAVLRDGAFIGGMCIFGWKARSWFQPIFDFFKRANDFMTSMEEKTDRIDTGMQTLLTNHLSHIELDLKTMSGRKTNYVDPLLER